MRSRRGDAERRRGRRNRLIIKDGRVLFAAASFDMVIADFVLEHIVTPAFASAELRHILKPGARTCARTPNKHCPVSLAPRVIYNSQHSCLLRWVQPGGRAVDVFPAVFGLRYQA